MRACVYMQIRQMRCVCADTPDDRCAGARRMCEMTHARCARCTYARLIRARCVCASASVRVSVRGQACGLVSVRLCVSVLDKLIVLIFIYRIYMYIII